MNEEGMAGWWVGMLAGAKARLEALGADLAQSPAESLQLFESTRASLMTGTGVRGFTYLMILLFVGIAVEWLYWTYAYSPLRAAYSSPAGSPFDALRAGLRRAILQGAGLLLFTAAVIGVSAAFTWPEGMHPLVIQATLFLVALRLSWIAVSVILAPGRPQRQLVPIDPARARSLTWTLMAALALVALGHFVPAILQGATGARHAGSVARFASFSVATLILFVAAFSYFGRRDRRIAPAAAAPDTRAPIFPRSFVLAVLIVAVYVVWLMSPSASVLAAVVAIVLAIEVGLRDIVYFYWREDAASSALPAIALSLARFLVALVGIGAAALALDTPLATFAESVSPWVRIGLRLLGVAVLGLLAHGVWIAVRSVVDQRLAAIGPIDPHEPPDASSRLLTLLPLLRLTTAVLLLALLVLSSLWALGIEITPLLAGAGVLGIALGFGAQALVRDVIAGVFYLADDAFRVGEYIEGGGNTKGTVERITLRSVALRHHNGPLHFVPYGALGSVRNTSRDWVIDKFNLPLPIDVESEKIRKMIKKIGEEMKNESAVGQHILEPLKGKLYRIDPGVKVFRCKFRCPPGKQFDIRAAALKRIESALKEMGVGFAAGVSTVVVKG
ncbi:MAG TPA: mechanosensitive ion channel domain-containing protein [Burkholderiales bacterium]|nr:mechanosensitive ion channel domain-containing protein [Burkholderiales bacterium]